MQLSGISPRDLTSSSDVRATLALVVKLIIAGSRSLHPTDEQIDAEILKLPIWGEISPDVARVREVIALVVSGRSPGGGVDACGERWARDRCIEVHPEPITDADVRRYGKFMAPKVRNSRMAEVGDVALVFWDGISNGSTDMVTRMTLRRKPVEVVPMRRPRGGSKRSAASNVNA